MSKIKILLSFQSAEQRSQIEEAFKDLSDILIIDSCPSGNIALKQSKEYEPDVIIIGDFLGDMNAAEFTSSAADNHNIGIFIISDEIADKKSASITLEALNNGAIDFIDYQWDNDKEKNIAAITRRLLPKIRAFSIKKYSLAARTISSSPYKNITINESLDPTTYNDTGKYKIVLIGASTGGPEALKTLIPKLRKDFPIPIVIALHMPAEYTGIMAASLDKKTQLGVMEAKSQDTLIPGNVYLAPGGYHLLLKKKSDNNYYFTINQDPPVNGCRPSVDVLFKSAAKICSSDTISVMLTGMGVDGTEGMIELHNKGAYCIAQDEESSVVWGMPGSVVGKGIINTVLPLNLIADKLNRLSNTKK